MSISRASIEKPEPASQGPKFPLTQPPTDASQSTLLPSPWKEGYVLAATNGLLGWNRQHLAYNPICRSMMIEHYRWQNHLSQCQCQHQQCANNNNNNVMRNHHPTLQTQYWGLKLLLAIQNLMLILPRSNELPGMMIIPQSLSLSTRKAMMVHLVLMMAGKETIP
jgi:hypothetical protein